MAAPKKLVNDTARRETGRRYVICVFCGPVMGRSQTMAAAARLIGQLIGQRGHHLVYGAGGSGLMGEVAWSAWRNGAGITGIVPGFVYEQQRDIVAPPQVSYVTKNLVDRNQRMIEHSDAFIALPGGYGTVDEILEVLAFSKLQVTGKPLVLLNTENFWNGLIELAGSMHETGFAERSASDLFHVAESPVEAVDTAERAVLARSATRR
jgi:cytokinin riboside 5'-monophosphate phosphoribohydrolase